MGINKLIKRYPVIIGESFGVKNDCRKYLLLGIEEGLWSDSEAHARFGYILPPFAPEADVDTTFYWALFLWPIIYYERHADMWARGSATDDTRGHPTTRVII